ncbi:putative sur7 protein [Erysiphe neolycopersici]|uniref:Putative sur7 protein n=1 Tax=Erysiphe neolycopersici TaxID=212602 RepID=A0A420HFB1_9PEZI|nr:putative sur7 protein [Erysiphe neolycopersici]
MRPLVIVPLACSLAGLVLSFLLIFAGNRPGFMKDFQIVTLNMSTLGHDILPKLSKASPTPILAPEDDLLTSVSGITDQLNGIFDDIADDIVRSLGVQQFYNWHLRNFCEGMYEPSYKADNASFAVKDCSKPTASYHFKIGDIIDRELRLGPLHIGLKDLKWPDSLQKNFDMLSKALHAALAFYAISITATGLSIMTGLLVFFGNTSLLLSLTTWVLMGLSFFSLFVSSIIVVIVNSKSIKIVEENGSKIGIFAYKGHKYIALTWCSTFVMLLAVLSFGASIFFGRRSGEKKTEK